MYHPSWEDSKFLVVTSGDGQGSELCHGWEAMCQSVLDCHYSSPDPAQVAEVMGRLTSWDDWERMGFEGMPYMVSWVYEDGSCTVVRVTSEKPRTPGHVLLGSTERPEQLGGGAVMRSAVSHDTAKRSAQRLVNSHFGNRGRALTRLPAQPEDDDLLIMSYIQQQEDRELWVAACVMPPVQGDYDLVDAAKARSYDTMRHNLYERHSSEAPVVPLDMNDNVGVVLTHRGAAVLREWQDRHMQPGSNAAAGHKLVAPMWQVAAIFGPHLAQGGPDMLEMGYEALVGQRGGPSCAALGWAVSRWEAEVKDRPLVNANRRPLDDAWRQVIRHFGGDPVELCGPSHDDLLAAQSSGANGAW